LYYTFFVGLNALEVEGPNVGAVLVPDVEAVGNECGVLTVSIDKLVEVFVEGSV
jgi:hypothetical protein